MQLMNLKTKIIGKEFIYYEQIDSTQEEIWRMIKDQKIKSGTLVMSELQTKGKGTHGRIWHTDEKNNIAFSFYLEMNCNIQEISSLTLEMARNNNRYF